MFKVQEEYVATVLYNFLSFLFVCAWTSTNATALLLPAGVSCMGWWGPGFWVSVHCEEQKIRRLEGKGVGSLEARPKSPLILLLEIDRYHEGIMVSYGHATSKIKKLLEIYLLPRVKVQFIHHVVKDMRIPLVLCEDNQFCIHNVKNWFLKSLQLLTFYSAYFWETAES